jgi:flagellar motor switch protein FliM
MASAGFARELRTHVQISLTSVEQSTFEEYVRVLSDKTTPVLNIVSAEPLLGSLVFEYSMELGSVMIDHLLGGTGATGYTERAVTEIEEILLRSMGEIFTTAYGDAWTDLIPITPALQRIEYTPRFLQVASLAAPVLVVIFDVRMDERSYEMSLCLPYAMIESEVGKLNMQALFMAAPGQAESQKVPEQNLVGVRVPLAVELGQAEIPFGAIAGLAVGDLVRLNAHKQDPVLVRVNGLPAFLGRPGLLAGDRVGVQVLTTIKTEEETR